MSTSIGAELVVLRSHEKKTIRFFIYFFYNTRVANQRTVHLIVIGCCSLYIWYTSSIADALPTLPTPSRRSGYLTYHKTTILPENSIISLRSSVRLKYFCSWAALKFWARYFLRAFFSYVFILITWSTKKLSWLIKFSIFLIFA